ncbi:hypothetical protein C1634_023190 [Chryseobacterium viscerum]|uniref:Uncharacterized protein n=1 Tax=Chryseobacterium viscerum TaxID=1037377 RepID=A0A316WAY5_9FLAO|nr:hypothetical protein C1634_023190 [Chryseobacterium viscerum]
MSEISKIQHQNRCFYGKFKKLNS